MAVTDNIDSTIAGASAAHLRRLISLANERPQSTEAVVPRLADPTELTILLDEIAPAAVPNSNGSMVAAVLDPATPLTELETVYRQARELIKRAENVTQKAAAELLYHAAVAAAHARHGANIANRPIEARRALYKRLADLLGPSPLANIFRSILPSS
jgi:hypothetical protein